MLVNPKRIRVLNGNSYASGTVLYWMSRDQRVEHNWALYHAIDLANAFGVKLSVIFFLPNYENIKTLRQNSFLIGGLKSVSTKLKKMGVGFSVNLGAPHDIMHKYILNNSVGYLVSDFTPFHKSQVDKLRISKKNTHSNL